MTLARAFHPETMAEYIREDLKALEDPHRADTSRILQDLAFSFRMYGRALRRAPDWRPA